MSTGLPVMLILEHLGLHCLAVLSLGVAEFETVLAEFGCNLGAHLAGVVGTEGLGHYVGGNDSVFHDQVGDSCELAAVSDRIGEEPVNLTVVEALVFGVDYTLEKEIGLFKLVVEEDIIL